MTKQHVQLPKNDTNNEITPKDKLIYLNIRRHMNRDSKQAYPSLATICKESGASINTVRKSIKVLEENNYITISKQGKKNIYHFNETKSFEPFSYEFLDNPNLTFLEKSYIVATQQFMNKDVKGYGVTSYTNKELSEMINMPESTVSKTNRTLEQKNYLTTLKNKKLDSEYKCTTSTKIFNLEELGQAVIWFLQKTYNKVQDHDIKVQEHDDKLKHLENRVAAQDKLIAKLMAERKPEELKIILE